MALRERVGWGVGERADDDHEEGKSKHERRVLRLFGGIRSCVDGWRLQIDVGSSTAESARPGNALTAMGYRAVPGMLPRIRRQSSPVQSSVGQSEVS